MPRLTSEELCLENLREKVPIGQLGYMTKAEAHTELVRITGQDFGMDVAKWDLWFHQNPTTPKNHVEDPLEAVRLARRIMKI